MPDEGGDEREVCSVKGCSSLASTEITSSFSGLPTLCYACDEHASNFERGGRFFADPRKGTIDLGFRGRLRPNSVVNYVGPIAPKEPTHTPVEQVSDMDNKIEAVYGDLSKPSIQEFYFPPVELMQREQDRDFIVATAQSATEAMVDAMKSPEPVSPQLYRLGRVFGELLGREPHGGAIVAGSVIGYIIGEMENESGVEREGMSEQHYECALQCAMAFLPDEVTDSYYFLFAEECGYYLARMRGRGLDDLCAIARQEVEWMESHGVRSSSESDPVKPGAVIYEVETWQHRQVVKLVAALEGAHIPYQWDDEGLCVDRQFESAVDALISHL